MFCPQFTKDKSVLEQVLGLERLADEYHSAAKEEISDNTKLSVLRQHIQLSMDEGSTYATTREKFVNYERTTASWNSSTVYKELDIRDRDKGDEAVPMEIDTVKGFNKGKGKKGGKGKSYGKDSKSKGKGKNDWKPKRKQSDTYEGKGFKGYGKQDGQGKGKGGLAYDLRCM